ncbi:hypothetical protein BJ875DRAFT_175695 [Amylocarpus encephaloides]|uniref:Uncharacterized protein n=1 Tax=Amylocarpus encephaloides TaxID=45428 RepID=A0A9P8C263_9HELO|nr:hypothetical protein BJ875DRAFT_175695 [Amylocarpus encephaloides]
MSEQRERLFKYLSDPHQVRAIGLSPPPPSPPTKPRQQQHRQRPAAEPSRPAWRGRDQVCTSPSAGSPTRSEASTVSSAPSNGSDGYSDGYSAVSSSSSSLPSTHPPWGPFDQQLAMANFNYGYDLPCECSFMDCYVRFHPEYYADWVAHARSHFIDHPLPSKLVCTFCPTEFDSARTSNGDTSANFNQRMIHIGNHFFQNRDLHTGTTQTHPKPDFFMLEHLWRTGLLADEDYRYLTRYTERPPCDGLRDRDFVTPEEEARRSRVEREGRRYHNQADEDRRRRRERNRR